MSELFDLLAVPDTTCFACGAARRGVVGACPGCGKRPSSTAEWRSALSQNGYPLTDELQPRTDGDTRFDNPVFRAVNQRSLEQSLADKQLQELLGLNGQAAPVEYPTRPQPGEPQQPASAAPSRRSAPLTDNPFHTLCVATTHSAADIDAMANTAPSEAGKTLAASSVLDSASRLHAELRWLADLPFEEARSLISGDTQGLPSDPLASVNLQCFRLVADSTRDAAAVAEAVGRISDTWARISAADTLRTLNTTRHRAGIRSIADEATVSGALLKRQHEIVADLLSVLEALPSDTLLQCFETFSGVARAPGKVIQALVAHYRTFAEPVLVGEGDKVVALCRRGANLLRSGEPLAPDFVERLGALMALYHRLLKPLRSSPQGLGVVRTLSRMMREAFADLSDAAQQFADVEDAASLSSMQNTYFKRR